MTSKGPFQPKAFYDSVKMSSLRVGREKAAESRLSSRDSLLTAVWVSEET